MGATRLMVLLAGISKLVKLGKQCRAQRVGVDLFGWLHQEAVTHYDSLVVQRPPDYRPVVQAIVGRAAQRSDGTSVEGAAPTVSTEAWQIPRSAGWRCVDQAAAGLIIYNDILPPILRSST
jgi:hypothetical protein